MSQTFKPNLYRVGLLAKNTFFSLGYDQQLWMRKRRSDKVPSVGDVLGLPH